MHYLTPFAKRRDTFKGKGKSWNPSSYLTFYPTKRSTPLNVIILPHVTWNEFYLTNFFSSFKPNIRQKYYVTTNYIVTASYGQINLIIYFIFLSHSRTKGMAFKVCLADGTWFRHPLTNKTWSNYTTCIDQEDLSFRHKINNLYIGGYTISVIALAIALVIFFSFT